MTAPHPPRASPTLPKVVDEEPTNPGAPADHGWVRSVVAEAERATQKKTGIWGLLAIVAAAGIAGFTVKQALAADAKGLVDAGVVPLEKRLAIVEQDQRHQAERIELANKKLDVVLDALRVPYDRRPAMTDGGQ